MLAPLGRRGDSREDVLKICPECGAEWAPKFKFCPEDGTVLPAEAPPAKATPATSPSKRPRAAAPADKRLLDIEPAAAAPAPRRAAEPKSATFDRPEPRPQRLVKDSPSRVSARVQAARSEAPRGDGTATAVHEVVSRTNPTALLEAAEAPEPAAPRPKRLRPAVPAPVDDPHDELMSSATRRAPRPDGDAVALRAARATPRAPVPAREPEEVVEVEAPVAPPKRAAARAADKAPEKKPAKKQRDFSETAWFMRQPNPEDADPATGKVKVGKKAYAVEEPIPDEKRKQFSLRRNDED